MLLVIKVVHIILYLCVVVWIIQEDEVASALDTRRMSSSLISFAGIVGEFLCEQNDTIRPQFFSYWTMVISY